MSSSSIIFLVLLIVVAGVAAFALFRYVEEKRTRHLREKFGPEYGRLEKEAGGPPRSGLRSARSASKNSPSIP